MIANASVIFTVDGVQKRLDFRRVPLMVWEQLEDLTGLTSLRLVPALADQSVKAVVALIWLERKQRDRKVKFETVRAELMQETPDIDVIDLIRDGKSILTYEEVEDAQEDADGPSGASS